MDRRSWLWRRKSSEKSPGETESTGSVSSHSERFSDDQVYPTHSSQSPEITSKAAPAEEDVNDSVKNLTEKLSAALVDISTKEELVKQHAKVAEEAVSGWEQAEKEVLALRQQLDAATKKNSALEDRVSHLDGALKECVRQLRQAREEQEQKIREAVTKKASEWESETLNLQSQLAELQVQLQNAKSTASVDYDLQAKLEKAEKENAALRTELLSRAEEVEMRILERDLSSQAAEAASKQHLESIKKVAKLEAECRRLKALARKAPPSSNLKSAIASSIDVESYTDRQSDKGEKLLPVEIDMGKMSGLEVTEKVYSMTSSRTTEREKHEKAIGRTVPSADMNLMDDFLEMEKLVALPVSKSESVCLERLPFSNQVSGVEKALKAELEVMTHKITELEQKLEKREAEKADLVVALIECQEQLRTMHGQLEEASVKLVDFETQLAVANESRQAAEKEAKATKSERQVIEARLRAAEDEIRTLLSKISSLQKEAERETAWSAENVKKYQNLEDELRLSHIQQKESEAKLTELRAQLVQTEDLRQTAVKEVTAVIAEREMLESKLRDAKAEVEALLSKVGSLEHAVESERAFSARSNDKCQRMEDELGTSQSRLQEAENKLVALENQLALANELTEASKKEVVDATAKSEMLQSQLRAAEAETRTLLSKIRALHEEVEKEHSLSAEYKRRCEKLEDELSKVKAEPEREPWQYSEGQHVPISNGDFKIRQEKELAEAASKLAECQKTIASLGNQLKSLAKLDDFLNEFDEPLELNYQGLHHPLDDNEPWKLNSTDFQSPTESESLNDSAERESSTSLKLNLPSEKSQNGLGNSFSGLRA